MQITLPKGAKDISVIISDGNNNVVSGAAVTIAGQEQTTDNNGKANFEDIKEGSQTVTVTKSGFADYSGSITVGTNVTFSISLTPVGTLSITVNDGTDAISGASVVLDDTTKTTNEEGKVDSSSNSFFVEHLYLMSSYVTLQITTLHHK